MNENVDAYAILNKSHEIISKQEINKIINRLAKQISYDLRNDFPLVIPVMTGGLVLAGQLLPLLDFPLQLDYVHVSRYRGAVTGSDHIEWIKKPNNNVDGRSILLVDDILDEGVTAKAISETLIKMGACKVLLCVLLDKIINKPKPINAKYIGSLVENQYVFGFGMDIKNLWRNLTSIYVYKENG
tara:strand:+ start:221 stop:775 length:555 start_codon:yes stop_codon:yes gene_type:complete